MRGETEVWEWVVRVGEEMGLEILLNASSCARHTNWNIEVWSRERLLAGSSKETRWLVLKTPPELPDGFRGEVFTGKFGMSDSGCVTFFWLVGGEITGQCSKNPVLSLKLPSFTWVGSLVSAEELKDIILFCIFLQEEPRPCPTAELLFLTCSSFVSASPPFPD